MSIMSKIGFVCMMLYEGGGAPSSTSGDIVLSVVSLTGAKEKKGITDKGHSFVIIENKTDVKVDVGYYNLKPNEEVSVGLWYGSFFAGPDEFEKIGGVYYNREFYEYNLNYEPESLVSCKCVIDEHSLWFVSQIIKKKTMNIILLVIIVLILLLKFGIKHLGQNGQLVIIQCIIWSQKMFVQI